MTYLRNYSTKQTPQNQPIPSSTQVPNSAGGFAWAVDDWERLDRFLVLGSEGGSYYATEQKLTRENADAVLRCIQTDSVRVVKRIVEISAAGRAPKNDPAIFCLAMVAGLANTDGRTAALEALPAVCRIGTHLMHFAEYVSQFRGWGRGLRKAVGQWYNDKPAKDLAYQVVKYQRRDKWSNRDLLRLSHPAPISGQHKEIYHWITQGWESVGDQPHPDEALRLIWACERAKQTETQKEIVSLIRDYRLPREAIPTQWLTHIEVWEALLDDMPMTAMIRNLATMTRVGLLAPLSEGTKKVVEQLGDVERLRKSRIHPIAVLSALKTYQQGHGERGHNTWEPVSQIIDALDGAFYGSFGNVTPTNKRIMLALDVSGSMGWRAIAGIPGLTPRVGSAAMALITAATEPNHAVVAFSHQLIQVQVSPRQRLDDVVRRLEQIPMGGTDCALPMLWAMDNNVKADGFVIYTDSETWHGQIHPAQAMQKYRQQTAIAAKLVVCGMVANEFSIADPNDGGMMDVVGFDTATPQLISDFLAD